MLMQAPAECPLEPSPKRRGRRRPWVILLVVGIGVLLATGAVVVVRLLPKEPRRPRIRGPLLGKPAPGIAIAVPRSPSTGDTAQKGPAAPKKKKSPLGDDIEFWANGNEVDFEEVQAKAQPVLLYFWHPRDGKSLPTLSKVAKLAERFAPKGLVTVGLCVVDGPPDVVPHLKADGVKFPIALDCDGDAHRRYRIDTLGTPYCYLVDRKQIVAWDGPPEDLTEREVKEILR